MKQYRDKTKQELIEIVNKLNIERISSGKKRISKRIKDLESLIGRMEPSHVTVADLYDDIDRPLEDLEDTLDRAFKYGGSL